MESSIRRSALRQAAKVAFGSLVISCGGTVSEGNPLDAALDVKASDAAADAQAVDSPADSPADVVIPFDGSLACTGPVDVDASSVNEQIFQCCLGVVEQLTGDAGFVVVDAGAITGDPSIDNCCKAIIAHVDTTTTDYSAAIPTLGPCCSALGYPMGPACTPWGPPTPPAVPYEWLALIAPRTELEAA
jgi:hypothetical protein